MRSKKAIRPSPRCRGVMGGVAAGPGMEVSSKSAWSGTWSCCIVVLVLCFVGRGWLVDLWLIGVWFCLFFPVSGGGGGTSSKEARGNPWLRASTANRIPPAPWEVLAAHKNFEMVLPFLRSSMASPCSDDRDGDDGASRSVACSAYTDDPKKFFAITCIKCNGFICVWLLQLSLLYHIGAYLYVAGLLVCVCGSVM